MRLGYNSFCVSHSRPIQKGTSPKPCIVPGNALQLIDDDPAASRSHTPSSVIVFEDGPHAAHDASADSSADAEGQRVALCHAEAGAHSCEPFAQRVRRVEGWAAGICQSRSGG